MCPEEVTSSYLCEERNHHLSLQRIHQNVSSSDIEERNCTTVTMYYHSIVTMRSIWDGLQHHIVSTAVNAPCHSLVGDLMRSNLGWQRATL
eukprot:scaffold2696_cov144-Skeletonema_marinoi.AAC.12